MRRVWTSRVDELHTLVSLQSVMWLGPRGQALTQSWLNPHSSPSQEVEKRINRRSTFPLFLFLRSDGERGRVPTQCHSRLL
mmetsp:Transcript_41894/g.98213  ORF Transcript_41894/g.98213 Transcript_41894/m.98213 type:complete len:81 (-) Transcript_41894:12-254(-)